MHTFYIYIYIYIYIHTHTYIYIYTYIHTYSNVSPVGPEVTCLSQVPKLADSNLTEVEGFFSGWKSPENTLCTFSVQYEPASTFNTFHVLHYIYLTQNK